MSNNMGFKQRLYNFVKRITRVEIVNPEKEPEYGVLLCSNHISLLDPISITVSMKRPPKFMAKKELFKIPIVSSVIKLFGAFPVDRGNADITAMKKAITLLDDGCSVGLFPQGTRCAGINPEDTKAKKGIGMLIIRSHCDILPVAIISKRNKCSLFRKKYIVIGDVIKYDSLGITDKSREEFERVSSFVFEKICDLHKSYRHYVD